MILVVGDVMDDVIVRPEGSAAPGTDQRAGILRRPGGSGASIACWLGHRGVAVRFAGRVGVADLSAHRAEFARHGVRAELAGDAKRPTGVVVAVLGADGERGFFTDRGANLGLCEADLPDVLLNGARALHVSGHVFFEAVPRAAAMRLMRAARAGGVAISVDAGSAGWLAGAGAGAFRKWTEDAELCFANAEEAALLDHDYKTFVVTHGAAGATARRGDEVARVAAASAAVIDGTGAGDAFAAGFLAARLGSASLAECLAAGAGCAGQCLGTSGGRPP